MGRIRHRWVLLAAGVLVLAGLGLFAYGLTIPVYSDQGLASSLKVAACYPEVGNEHPLSYYGERIRSLRTLRHPFMQGGLSLVTMALVIGLLFIIFPASEGRGLATPADPRTLVRLGIASIVAMLFALLVADNLDFDRGDALACGPAWALVAMGLVVIGPVIVLFTWAIGRYLTTHMVNGPVPLFSWDNDRPRRSMSIALPFAILGVALVALAAIAATTSSFLLVPALMVFIYVLAASRAMLTCVREVDEPT